MLITILMYLFISNPAISGIECIMIISTGVIKNPQYLNLDLASLSIRGISIVNSQ